VQDKRDDGEEKKQMNEESGGVEHEESAEPKHDQNNGEYEKHGNPTFSFRNDRVYLNACFYEWACGRDVA
jgi:hypothetical protein